MEGLDEHAVAEVAQLMKAMGGAEALDAGADIYDDPTPSPQGDHGRWEANQDVHDWLNAGIMAHGLVDHHTGTWQWFSDKAMKILEHFCRVEAPVPSQGVVDIVEIDNRPGRKPRLMPPMMEEVRGADK